MQVGSLLAGGGGGGGGGEGGRLKRGEQVKKEFTTRQSRLADQTNFQRKRQATDSHSIHIRKKTEEARENTGKGCCEVGKKEACCMSLNGCIMELAGWRAGNRPPK